MIWRVRRVLTGHDAHGRSTFLADGEAQNVKEMASMPGLALTDLWETAGAPASNTGDKDSAARPVRLEPPKNGTILRIVEFPPDTAWRGSVDGKAAFKSIGAVVKPGEKIAEILPSAAPLMMEARIASKDIPKVVIGQSVEIVFPTDQTDVLPPLKGTVIRRSSCACPPFAGRACPRPSGSRSRPPRR